MNGKATVLAGTMAPVVHRHDDAPSHTETSENPQRNATRQKHWQNKNPKARWAHLCLASALRRGLIHKQTCRDCGEAKVDGHHPDYDRPMAVVWLCRRHHVAEHRRLKAKRHGAR